MGERLGGRPGGAVARRGPPRTGQELCGRRPCRRGERRTGPHPRLCAGSRPRPYRAELRLRTLSGADWDHFLEAAAAQPGHIAALLDKDMPHSLVDAAAEAGVALLPAPGDLVPSCTCPDSGRPCKHAAALCYETARLLDADPFVLLLMRGRGERELLDELARRSAAHSAREQPPHRPSPESPPGRPSPRDSCHPCPRRCPSGRTPGVRPPIPRRPGPPTPRPSTTSPPTPRRAPTRCSPPGPTPSAASPPGRTRSGWQRPAPPPG